MLMNECRFSSSKNKSERKQHFLIFQILWGGNKDMQEKLKVSSKEEVEEEVDKWFPSLLALGTILFF